MLNYFPNFFTSKAISIYFAALLVSNILFFNHILDWKWWIFGIIEAVGFFYYSNQLTRNWMKFKEERFLKKLFYSAFILRLTWMIIGFCNEWQSF
jgi:heme O synthase-like polyprenyltransferase